MKTIKSLKDITTLEVGDVIVFGTLEYRVAEWVSVCNNNTYFLYLSNNDKESNEVIFQALSLNKKDFVQNLGIDAYFRGDFPETKSLEALTAVVSALFKEYEQQNELPKTWKEFCERNPIKGGEWYINNRSEIEKISEDERNEIYDKNVFFYKSEAEAFLALTQLRQLRKAYVKDWEPDYKQQYYGIVFNIHGLDIIPYTFMHKSMSFPTYKLAKQFLNNFKDLLEIAKPLL